MSTPLQRLVAFIERAMRDAFFGKLTITFQAGRICEIKTEQTRKIEELT